MPVVTFRPLRRADFAQLRGWLNEPHVYEWWGVDAGPDALGGPGPKAATADQVDAKYGPAVDGLDPTSRFVILLDGDPAGLIQWYRLEDSPDYAAAIGEPTGAGVDVFLGDPGRIGTRDRGGGDRPLRHRRGVRGRPTSAAASRDPTSATGDRSARSPEPGSGGCATPPVPGEPAPEHVMVRGAPEPGR